MGIVVVGGGLAGAHAVEELRAQGHTGPVTLIGSEQHPPYERPPLSKGLLLGTDEPDSPIVRDAGWYADHDVELLTGHTVTAVDTAARRVALGDRELDYDRLLLATGARPRRLAVADDSGAEVAYLRTLEDSLALKERLGGHLLVIGAGWIGLEVASAARQAGGSVTVVESASLPLERVLGPEVAPVFAELHREHGVDLRLGTGVAAVEHTGGGTRVVLDDGSAITPDLVVVGIGAVPEDRLAVEAGLAVDGGVLVDARLRTSDDHVFAAGDVAHHDHPVLGHRIRVEHWDTAIHQGKHAARAMLGDDAAYDRQPYFFTDQYDLGMEYVGHTGAGYDDVVLRGDLAGRIFSALWIRGDRVVAGMHVNDWDAIDPLKAVVGREATAAVRDPGVPLADLAD
ncbi:NAD(P)/FAD-dependent oxidoreductase [Nocardioides euryhalodurans]|uniref:NAD(P)/FAD-dependent oxidoreductase n=1 Tax=Nocardioides euryhalodurans TaxID=2518370 RepID=A0A4P7GQA8_9ACTN|nr:FAD-dependent oxidoreductase [Nocardioides euryhalodurans]QBR94219.1 NAD(P)/FAD-dependent oxidoreductase [Nocardioides euryhalodurans]